MSKNLKSQDKKLLSVEIKTFLIKKQSVYNQNEKPFVENQNF